MSLEKFKKAGITFSCGGEGTCVPEIPRIQDVLYALRLSDEEEYYSFGLGNHQVYNANVHLVAAAVGFEVTFGPKSDEEIRRIIAQAIVDLCPEHVRCLFQGACVDARQVAGETLVVPMTAHATREACGCRRCNRRLQEERYAYD